MPFKIQDAVIPRKNLEALVEALIHYSGYRDPKSPVYQARNPGDLQAFRPDQMKDDSGRRVFPSVIDGMQAALWDMALKLSGQSVARLQPEQTLQDLVTAYHLPETSAAAWANFLKHALRTNEITSRTRLDFFLKDK